MPLPSSGMELSQLARLLVLAGVALAGLGALLWVLTGLGVGRLPGDLSFGRGNVRVFVPLGTMLLLSIVLTVALNLLLRR